MSALFIQNMAIAEDIDSLESLNYSMEYPKMGKCYIFNHEKFNKLTGLGEREGTKYDAASLYCCFKNLNFDVQIFPDRKASKVLKKLRKSGAEDHSDKCCFVCCILTHGGRGTLWGKDKKYPTNLVFERFKEDVCPSLAGKPKIFFIQACQGDKLDIGVKAVCRESFDCAEPNDDFTIFTDPDFLIGYAAIPGFCSFRNTKKGSWFIQCLCQVLKKSAKTTDLLTLMTTVIRKVAFECESRSRNPEMNQAKQMPYIVSTLTKVIRFPP